MDEDTINKAIANFLISKEFVCDEPLIDCQHGIDVKARKGRIQIFVESKGSQKNGALGDKVFNHGQIVNHIARQVHTLMKYATEYGEENNIFVLASPDIPRIRSEYKRINIMVERLHFICMWVQSDQSVKVEGPDSFKELLRSLCLN